MRYLQILSLFLLSYGVHSSETRSQDENWYRSASIYHIWLKSFADSTDEDQVGDIQGIIERFDYLNDGQPLAGNDLEVDTLLLSPFYLSARSSSDPNDNIHGYDVVDYYQVNPVFGSKDDLKALLNLAHSRGVRILFDFVPAYTSIKHPWFIEAAKGGKKRNWYVWNDEPSFDWQAAWGGGHWYDVWKPHSDSYFYSYFQSAEIADLNHHHPDVRAAMADILKYWLDFGFDGARIDGAPYLIEDGPGLQADRPATFELLKHYRQIADSYSPKKVLVAETWRPAEKVGAYFGNGADQIQMGFDFDLAWRINKALSQESMSPISKLKQEQKRDYPQGYQMANFLSNHDSYLPRPMTQYKGDSTQAYAAAAIQLLSNGTPVIFYGNELGMLGEKSPDIELRKIMNWQNVVQQEQKPNSLLSAYKNLLRIRNRYEVLRMGDELFLSTGHSALLSFARFDLDSAVLVLINLSDTPLATSINLQAYLELLTQKSYQVSTLLGQAKYHSHLSTSKTAFDISYIAAQTVTVLYFGDKAQENISDNIQPIIAPVIEATVKAQALPSLYLRGDMNQWDGSLPMTLINDEEWQVKVELKKGRYQYKFEIVGQNLWSRNWGDNEADGVGDIDGKNIKLKVKNSACYAFTFNQLSKEYRVEEIGLCH